MPDASFSHASAIAWKDYYRAIEGRPLRPSFPIEFLPIDTADGRRPVAVDLGCGAGTETLALLGRGWTVTVDVETNEPMFAAVKEGA